MRSLIDKEVFYYEKERAIYHEEDYRTKKRLV
jgi:hypothetical protein